MIQSSDDNSIPFCVDLDGTLLVTDTLYEGIVLLLKKNPLQLLLLPFFLLLGKARLKAEIAKRGDLDVEYLPLNTALVERLGQMKKSGRKLVLATAANHRFAHAIAARLGLFDEVIASDDTNNLLNKAEILVARYGERGFDYAGNARVDLNVWRHARRAVVVGPSAGLSMRAVERVCVIEDRLPAPSGVMMAFVRGLRPHQWPKNLLLFLPIFAAHRFDDAEVLAPTALGFLAFCILASALYMLNDLLDLSSDRRHPDKKNRPFATGRLPILFGLAIMPVMVGGALTLGWWVSIEFLMILCLYAFVSVSYSFSLKNIAILDVVILALLYVLRIISGGIVAEITVSFWLLSFSMFLFFSLAVMKRYAELVSLFQQKKVSMPGRGYRTSDLDIVREVGVASGFVAVLVLALYINSESVTLAYTYPKNLWALCPLLIYWIGYMWLTACRGRMHHDPVIFTLRDRTSLAVGLAGLVILVFAI